MRPGIGRASDIGDGDKKIDMGLDNGDCREVDTQETVSYRPDIVGCR